MGQNGSNQGSPGTGSSIFSDFLDGFKVLSLVESGIHFCRKIMNGPKWAERALKDTKMPEIRVAQELANQI